ncbi:MAG: rhodanese-like domain-containing protein [Candidatus Kapabacteria bacterium]|nr:rhodanese-like domain-containing protein [Candidatus Kapabacteria bacterium]
MTKEISSTDLHARLDAGEAIVLLDVRQPEEYAEQHIPNSILIPLGELPDRVDELEDYRDKEIVVICRSGSRSGQACMFLTMSGFENAVNMRGGMLSW